MWKHQKLQQQQSSLQAVSQGDVAMASVDADAAAAAYLANRGFGALVRNGAGDYALAISNARLLTTQAIVSLALRQATPGMIAFVATSTTSIQVLTWSATVAAGSVVAAADIDFYVRITGLAPA